MDYVPIAGQVVRAHRARSLFDYLPANLETFLVLLINHFGHVDQFLARRNRIPSLKMKSKPNTNSVTAALVMTVTLVKATICSREGQETRFSSTRTSRRNFRTRTKRLTCSCPCWGRRWGRRFPCFFCSRSSRSWRRRISRFMPTPFRLDQQGWRDSNPQPPVLETGALTNFE